MPKGLPKEVARHLEKSKESAIAAVDCYNRCGTRFRSGSYIVLMCIAWTSFFHAVFFKQKKKPFYREKDSKRFKKIDGDFKAWELATCLEQYFPGQTNAITENLKFLIGLRNKIEHRSMPELDNHIFGECQACLFNLEDLLLKEFGAKHCLSECLSLAIQFSQMRHDNQGKAISNLHRELRSDIKEYIHTFRSSLSKEINNDQKYTFRVFLIPKVISNPNQADLAVDFIKLDPSNPSDVEISDKIAALIKPSVVPVANAGKLKAGDVCKRVLPVVQEAIGKDMKFSSSYHHSWACIFYKIRPSKKSSKPEKTTTEFCQYDAAHKDYVYTEKWVTFLCEELRKPGQYNKIIEFAKKSQGYK
jgi:hypothetical protein